MANNYKPENTSNDGGSASKSNAITPNNLQDLEKAMKMLDIIPSTSVKSAELAAKKKYHFWQTQPVPQFDESVTTNEPIEYNKSKQNIRQEPFKLLDGFNWDTLNIDDSTVLKELYSLLNENYVEDDDNMFRFDYSPQFLKWALKPPNWVQDWHCGVRVTKSKKLVGFISAIPATIRVFDKTVKMVEINFLCVHKKLRSKRMAPVLIREITRRVNATGVFQAIYTAGVILPKPIGTCRYWHRSLNPKKLIEVKFSHLTRNMTMQRTIKLFKLPLEPKISGFRRLEKKDLNKVHQILNTYLQKFNLASVFSLDEVTHWFTPREDVIDSFVVEKDNEIIGFTSFYTLPSTVMHNPNYKSIKAAYSFYNVYTPSVDIQELMNDALIMAKNAGHDVFNALDLMENKKFLEPLKFGKGDGSLQYYLYNWRCPEITTEKIGLVLQ